MYIRKTPPFFTFQSVLKTKNKNKKKKTASHFRSDEVVNKVAKSLWNVDPCLLLQRERKKQIAVKVYFDSLTPWPAPGGFLLRRVPTWLAA